MRPLLKRRLTKVGCSLLLLVLVTVAPPARAQNEDDAAGTGTDAEDRERLLPRESDDVAVPDASGDIDEMVVLASGRDDFIKDMSVSMTSFSGAEIKSLRIQNIAGLAEFTPNLEINTRSAASNPTLFIRGIGLKDYNANAASAVAVYQDGINLNSPAIQLGQLFDTEEIVVLRGPQGSLNGRNATAGAIMVNSVLPNGEFDTSGSFTYGNFNAIELEGAIALPLIEDLLSTRMAFTANFRDGTTTNHCADWDPASIGSAPLTEQSIRDAWVFNGSPTNRNRFPNLNRPQSDAQGRPLTPDEVCIWDEPGALRFDQAGQIGEPVWVPTTSDQVRTLADFQGLKPTVNNIDNWAARIILRYQPDVLDGMDWILNAHGGQNRGDSSRLQALSAEFKFNTPNEGDPAYFFENIRDGSEVLAASGSGLEGIRLVDGLSNSGAQSGPDPGGRGGSDVNAGFYDSDGLELLNAWGLSLRGLWDTGPVDLNLITGFETYDRSIEDEGDAIPVAQFPSFVDDEAWQASAELRASGEGERYRWSLGAFYLHEDLDASNIFPGIQQRRIEQTFSQQLDNAAGYANGRLWLLEEVYLDGGLRYNWEQKAFLLESSMLVPGGGVPQIREDTQTAVWDGVTGEVALAWQPLGDWMYDARLDSLNVYVKYGRGMKGGHFNAGLTILPQNNFLALLEPVEPEFIHSFETGFKSRWLENRLILDFALFRYWYQDLQVFDFSNGVGEIPVQKLFNSDASVLGAELELQARPTPGLLIQFGVGWLDNAFEDFFVEKAVNSRRGGGGELTVFDYSGNPLISAPEWNFSGVVEYLIPLSRWGSLVPSYNFSYRTRVALDPQNIDPISQEPFWLHNARLAYRTPDGRFEVALWVENFLDQRYKIDTFDLTLQENTLLQVWNDPRTYGISFSAYF